MSAGWNTVESDAVSPTVLKEFSPANLSKGVFTYLIDSLGVKDIQFEELVALDANHLRQQRYHYTPYDGFIKLKLSSSKSGVRGYISFQVSDRRKVQFEPSGWSL